MVPEWFLRSPGNAGATEHLNGGERQVVLRVPRSAMEEKKARHIVNMDGAGAGAGAGGARISSGKTEGWCCCSGFQMPLHYPRYKKEEYEKMEEWKVDMVLREYGLSLDGSLQEKRAFAMGTFLWPDQL